MAATHGLASTYRSPAYKCRCAECREAHRQRFLEENARRAERLAHDPTLAEHGKYSTFTNWGCRCDKCTAAQSVENRRQYERRKAAKR